MPVTLRSAESSDENFLFELYSGARAEEIAVWGWDSEQSEAFLRIQFRAQQAHHSEYANTDHRIILDGERRIGRMLTSELDHEFRLVDIIILPEYRNAGIGAELIGELQKIAARSGKAVRLHVEKSNRAQRLYKRQGFAIVSDAGSHYLMEWRHDKTD